MKKITAILCTLLLLAAAFCAAGAEYSTELVRNVDAKQHVVQYFHANAEGEPVPGPDGYAVIECQYEPDKPYPTKIRYLDEKGKRTENPGGYAVIRMEYNQDNQVTAATFYGMDGKLTNTADGYARTVLQYTDGVLSSAAFTDSKSRKLRDQDEKLLETVSSWLTQEGTPIQPYENVSLQMDWSAYTGQEILGWAKATDNVNVRKEPGYSTIVSVLTTGDIVPYHGKQIAKNGILYYIITALLVLNLCVFIYENCFVRANIPTNLIAMAI